MVLALAVGLASACAHSARTTPVVPALQPSVPQEDPVTRLIARADAELAKGEAELREGHLNQAREAFDRAVGLYLEAPGGAYSDPRLSEAYRRTVDAVHLRDLEAIAAGDGFTEAQPEPAAIDDVGQIAVEETPPSDETRRAAEAAVQAEKNDFPVELNDAVLSCIALYQGRMREWFASALARGGRYLPYIREVFAAENIPQDLAYTALVESAFRTGALSRARARGVWQFIPATGKRYGLQQDWWVDERSDPHKATRAAARYLKALYGMFGDWNLALAGYNAGEGKVRRGLARYGATDFWSLARTRALKRETRNYVPMIHAAIVVANSPEGYGFEIEPEAPAPYDDVAVDRVVDLRTISECAGATLDDVRALNPELRRLATPAGRTYQVRVPQGSGEAAGACLESLPPEKRVLFRTHVVARGQTLASIARRYGTRAADIAAANGIQNTRRLARGLELIIPVPPKALAAATSAARRTPVRERAGEQLVRVSYRVKPGDTLGSIAEQYGTTIGAIQAWNGMRDARIAAGGLLTIFTRKF